MLPTQETYLTRPMERAPPFRQMKGGGNVTNDIALLAKWHRNSYIHMAQGIVADSFEGNSVFMSQPAKVNLVETPAECL